MLEVCEVVDFPVESSKYVDTRIEQELEALVQNSRNQTLRTIRFCQDSTMMLLLQTCDIWTKDRQNHDNLRG
jgi:hypothetical protein